MTDLVGCLWIESGDGNTPQGPIMASKVPYQPIELCKHVRDLDLLKARERFGAEASQHSEEMSRVMFQQHLVEAHEICVECLQVYRVSLRPAHVNDAEAKRNIAGRKPLPDPYSV
mmetsp:Transcript_68353/g.110143  ORF Transcript_68353/g.110143 Transcript_68353/m.110143 type:complete len:115 (-) Transcript_68353:50-394(-)